MEHDLLTIVYTSKAREAQSPEFLQELLRVSRERNLRDGITGFLGVRDGYFAQLLEGPEEKVRDCYKRIVSDPRHSQIILQGEVMVATRLMAEWNMALVEIDDRSTSAKDMLELFRLGRAGQIYTSANALHAILKIFCKDAKVLDSFR